MNDIAAQTGTLSASENASALLDLYEPLFQKICELRRLGARVPDNFENTRKQVSVLLADVENNASKKNPYLVGQVKQMKKAIVFFIDGMLIASQLPFAAQWKQKLLAIELYPPQPGKETDGGAGGNTQFFTLLKAELANLSEDATERLAVFYVCLGLGFKGVYKSQPDQIQQIMQKLHPRVDGLGILELNLDGKICKDAYFAPPVNVKGDRERNQIILWGAVFVAFVIAVILVNGRIFDSAAERLLKGIEEVHKKAKADEH